MTAPPNPAQVYEDFLVAQMFRPFGRDLVARAAPQPGDRVLDVGCGTGIVARLVAPLVTPAGAVHGLDPNAAMLAVARERATAEGCVIQWHEGDARTLLFDDASFDLILCQQALQFVPDRAAAVREMHRVLAPSGRVVIASWSSIVDSPVEEALDRIMAAYVGVSPLAVAFGLGGAGTLERLVRDAGFTDVTLVAVGMTLVSPSYAEYVRRVVLASMAALPAMQGITAEERDGLVRRVEAELRPAIGKYLVGEALHYPKTTVIATARA
jgi:ubiquinone/menaquinone biosynthesis C-methylase UbiE